MELLLELCVPVRQTYILPSLSGHTYGQIHDHTDRHTHTHSCPVGVGAWMPPALLPLLECALCLPSPTSPVWLLLSSSRLFWGPSQPQSQCCAASNRTQDSAGHLPAAARWGLPLGKDGTLSLHLQHPAPGIEKTLRRCLLSD